MKVLATTERLILREIEPGDAEAMFEMDSDPEVHKYLDPPVTDISQVREVIQHVRKQYIDNGTARLAIVDKDTNEFLGWTGLKLVKEHEYIEWTGETEGYSYYDLGYRLLKKHWGKGYATEAAIASVKYGFDVLGIDEIIGIADEENVASRRVLEKVGLKFIDVRTFWGKPHDRLSIKKTDWLNNAL